MNEPGGGAEPERRSVVRAFLLSDIRGYSTYAAIHGAEKTAALAARFMDFALEVISAHDGEIVDRRGDEVLAAFESARAAIRAAVAFERRLYEATRDDPSRPLPAGVGLDFGEAVVGPDGWGANAINISARLCSLAAGGEILATEQLIHVAQAMDGLTYVERAPVTVKGIARPVRHVRVVADELDTRQGFIDLGLPRAAPQPQPQPARRPIALVAAVVLTLLVAIGAVIARQGSTTTNAAPISADSVGHIETGSGRLVRQVELGGAPGAVAADANTVWVVNPSQNSVSEIDASNAQTASTTIPVGHDPIGVAIGYGSTWVTDSADRSVSRINGGAPPTVGDTIAVGNDPTAIAAGLGRLWVANSIDDTLSVIDPLPSPTTHKADQVVRTVRVGSQPDAVTTGFGSVWVANGSTATVSKVDPTTGLVTSTIGVGNGPDAIATGGDSIWVANQLDDTVSRIDPKTNAIEATIHVGHDPSSVTPSGDAVWVTNATDDSVSKISAVDNTVQRTIHVTDSPQGSAVSGSGLWVSARATAAAHRGGTFRIIEDSAANSFDPAVGYTPFAWDVLATTNDGLLTYQRTTGPGGATVVPDLATGLPQQTDNGRTYTFQLRSGLRYSNGASVRASDFRASMERALRIGQAPPYYTAIVGATACGPKRPTCDLSRGIITDDTSGVITIRLSHPDPDLLYKLAMPFAEVLPASTKVADLGFAPHPATGPYVISSTTRTTVTLTRNRYFEQWSSAAQPAGYPDHIVITINHSKAASAPDADINAVASGKYDWTPDQASSTTLAQLLQTKTGQLHPYPESLIRYFFLNTAEAPFNDPRVRRAVNLAVDREKAVAALGGQFVATTTCQLIMPSMAGYRPYCPYTESAGHTDEWTAPDLSAARSLIRQAGATGAHVTFVEFSEFPAAARLFATTLRSIGLKVTLQHLHTDYYTYIGDQSHHVQAALEGWSVDYPEPSNLITVLLRCADRTTSGFNYDESMFCDPAIDQEMNRALNLQVSDPAAAGVAWAQIDRQIDDLAPWVPLVNGRQYSVVSQRVGNVQNHPEYGLLIDQAWVQ